MITAMAQEVIDIIVQRGGRFLRRSKYNQDVDKYGAWPADSSIIHTDVCGTGVWIQVDAHGPVVLAKIKQNIRESSELQVASTSKSTRQERREQS